MLVERSIYGINQGANEMPIPGSQQPTMRFKHDCDKCIPLGQQGLYDLYYHPSFSTQTVIARYGNEGPDYKSGIALVGIDPELTEAFGLALDQNLIDLGIGPCK